MRCLAKRCNIDIRNFRTYFSTCHFFKAVLEHLEEQLVDIHLPSSGAATLPPHFQNYLAAVLLVFTVPCYVFPSIIA